MSKWSKLFIGLHSSKSYIYAMASPVNQLLQQRSQLSCLRHLRLYGMAPACSCLAGFTQLTGLHSDYFDSANIAHLQHLSALCSLRMRGQPTHADVGLLASMTHLTYLYVERMASCHEPSQRQIQCELNAVIHLCALTNLKSLLLDVVIDGQEYEANLDLDRWDNADFIVSMPASSLSIALHSCSDRD